MSIPIPLYRHLAYRKSFPYLARLLRGYADPPSLDSVCLVDGFPRSCTTSVVTMARLIAQRLDPWEPQLPVASNTHSIGAVRQALDWKIPAWLLLRLPENCVYRAHKLEKQHSLNWWYGYYTAWCEDLEKIFKARTGDPGESHLALCLMDQPNSESFSGAIPNNILKIASKIASNIIVNRDQVSYSQCRREAMSLAFRHPRIDLRYEANLNNNAISNRRSNPLRNRQIALHEHERNKPEVGTVPGWSSRVIARCGQCKKAFEAYEMLLIAAREKACLIELHLEDPVGLFVEQEDRKRYRVVL